MAPMNCATVKWSRECDINFSLSSTLECHHVHLQNPCAGPFTVCKMTGWGWGRGRNSVTNYSRRWKQSKKCCTRNKACQRPGLEHLMERRKLNAASQSCWLWTSTCSSEELDEALQNFVKPWKNVICEPDSPGPHYRSVWVWCAAAEAGEVWPKFILAWRQAVRLRSAAATHQTATSAGTLGTVTCASTGAAFRSRQTGHTSSRALQCLGLYKQNLNSSATPGNAAEVTQSWNTLEGP